MFKYVLVAALATLHLIASVSAQSNLLPYYDVEVKLWFTYTVAIYRPGVSSAKIDYSVEFTKEVN